MNFAKNLLIFAIFSILQHFAYLTEMSKDERIHRVKRQCGCCPCYGSRTSSSSCPCSSSCSCLPGTSNYPTGYGTMGYGSNAGYGSYGHGYGYGYDSAFNQGYPYATNNQYTQNDYGINNYIGNGCGLGGTASSTGCGMSNILPYNFGTGYGGGTFGLGNIGYGYPQKTDCSKAFNTRCYCIAGYSPCNNGASCCLRMR